MTNHVQEINEMVDAKTTSMLYDAICKKIKCRHLKIADISLFDISLFEKHHEYVLKAMFSDDWSYLCYGTHGISRNFISIDADRVIELKTSDEAEKMIVEKILEIGKCHNIYTSGPISGKLVIEAGTTAEKLLIEGDLDD